MRIKSLFLIFSLFFLLFLLGNYSMRAFLNERSIIYTSADNGKMIVVEKKFDKLNINDFKTSLPVFKSFGFSKDFDKILYTSLDSNGSPTGELYVEEVLNNKFYKVTQDLVMEAVWSPTDGNKIAFIFSTGISFGLGIVDLSSKRKEILISENVFPDLLSWDKEGKEIFYYEEVVESAKILDPISSNIIDEIPYSVLTPKSYTLKDKEIRKSNFLKNKENFPSLNILLSLGEFSQGIFLGEEDLLQNLYPFTIYTPNKEYEIVGEDLLGTGKIYVNSLKDNNKYLIGEGNLLKVLDEGIVLREINNLGTEVKLIQFNGEELTLSMSALSYYLPLKTSVVTQGGCAYPSPGNCNCSNSTHKSGSSMQYAYDFQSSTSGAHVLASEAGLVVYTYSSVNCNSCDTDGCSDYSSNCSSNSGWGNAVIIQHSDGTYTKYTHLQYNSIKVANNSTACKGLYIGNQGHTGCSVGYMNGCGDHLHFQRQTSSSLSGTSTSISFSDVASNPLSCGQSYTSGSTEVTACGSGAEIIVDDKSAGFTKYGTPSYWKEASIGYNSHIYWTYNNQSTIDNYAIWKPSLSSGKGNYKVYTYVPSNYATTKKANYSIYHNGVIDTIVIDQSIYFNEWVLLGTFYFSANGSEYVKLTDKTGETTGSKMIGFDAIKWVKQ